MRGIPRRVMDTMDRTVREMESELGNVKGGSHPSQLWSSYHRKHEESWPWTCAISHPGAERKMRDEEEEEYAPTLLASSAEPRRRRAPPGTKEVLRALEAQANALERSRRLIADQLHKLQVEERVLRDLVEKEKNHASSEEHRILRRPSLDEE